MASKEAEEEMSEERKRIRHLECELDNLEMMYKATKGVRDELEKENEELKEKLKNEISFNEQSETVKKYQEQIEELKAHCKAVDDVNEKMKCCGNCENYRFTGTCMIDDEEVVGDCICDKWELAT